MTRARTTRRRSVPALCLCLLLSVGALSACGGDKPARERGEPGTPPEQGD